MYPQYRASLGSRIVSDIVWYFRAAIRLIPEVFAGIGFLIIFLAPTVLAAFLV